MNTLTDYQRRPKAYTEAEFLHDFPDDLACYHYLANHNGMVHCEQCGTVTKHVLIESKRLLLCGHCGETTVDPRADTVFARSPKSLRKWFYAVYLVTRPPMASAEELAKKLHIKPSTATRMKALIQHQVQP